MRTAKTFFTDADKKKIEETIRIVESKTIGEVAVMVVDSSEDYREATVMGTIFSGSLASLFISILWFDASLWFFIAISVLLFFPFAMVFRRIPALRLPFTGIRRRQEAVRQRALRAFHEKGLHKTRANTGVLFFISLLEHKVWVLADRGIYEKIDQETLNTYARTVSDGIKEAHACDALCQEIKDAGEVLARHFPVTSGDTNELSDQVITE